MLGTVFNVPTKNGDFIVVCSWCSIFKKTLVAKNCKFAIANKKITLPYHFLYRMEQKKPSTTKTNDGSARPKRRLNGSTKSSSRLEKFLESLVLLGIKCLGTEKTHLLGNLFSFRIGLDLHVWCLENVKSILPNGCLMLIYHGTK